MEDKITDIEAVKILGKRHVFLDTISFKYLDEFESIIKIKKDAAFDTLRSRFRKALNECAVLGICKKSYQGSSAYQTGDTLGGKVYIDYDFTALLTPTKPV